MPSIIYTGTMVGQLAPQRVVQASSPVTLEWAQLKTGQSILFVRFRQPQHLPLLLMILHFQPSSYQMSLLPGLIGPKTQLVEVHQAFVILQLELTSLNWVSRN